MGGLAAVTGCNTQKVDFSAAGTGDHGLAQSILAALNHGDILTVGGTGHAYHLSSVFQEDGIWKVRLYNPWGVDATHTPNNGSSSAVAFENDGVSDGVITMDLATLRTNFRYFTKAIKP